MPTSKKIKLSASPSAALSTVSGQADIRSFARIGKAGITDAKLGKSNNEANPTLITNGVVVHHHVSEGSTKKRKRLEDDQPRSDDEDQCEAGQPEKKRTRPTNTASDSNCDKVLAQLPTPETTPTKPARFHDVLSTPTKVSLALTSVLATPPTTPQSREDRQSQQAVYEEIPDEILDIIQLHSAFLKALSLHFAHHGTTAPINIQDFTTSVSKIWGRRNVALLDIRRSLGIMQAAQATGNKQKEFNKQLCLELYDYGRGRLCMERTNVLQQRLVIARHIEEEILNRVFEEEVERSWTQWLEDHASKDTPTCNTAEFIHQLPLMSITPHPSLSKVAPLFTEGFRRLSSIKSLASASAQQTISISQTTRIVPAKPTTTATQSRSQNLMERLKAKKAHQSTLPAAPTKSALNRTAALHRLPEITSMLKHLGGGSLSKRQTFSMQSLVQRIQDSSRSPLSKEEVGRCLRLLADDVAPGWVKVVSTGGSVLGVVIDGGARPDDEELERRRVEGLATSIL